MKIKMMFHNLIPAIILAVILVFATNHSQRSLPQDAPVAVLNENADLMFFWNKNLKEKDMTTDQLKRGDSLRILGYASADRNKCFWVETEDGQRGMVRAEALPDQQEQDDYMVRSKIGSYHLSKEKFEKLCETKTPAELEKLLGDALTVCRQDSGVKMHLNLAVFDSKEGRFMHPDVSFPHPDRAGEARIDWKDSTDYNVLFLKWLPLTSNIIDMGHTLIDGGYYDSSLNAKWDGWKHFLFAAIAALLGLIWLFLTPFMIPHAVLSLVPLRYPLIWLGNKPLRMVVYALLFVCLYIWTVLALAWGASWWAFIPVMLILVAIFPGRFMEFLETRCPDCKCMQSYRCIESELVDEKLVWRTRSEYDKLVSKNTDRWTTYTERVTTWGDGHKTYDKFNIKQHQRTTKVHQYRDVKILYLDQEFLDTYACSCCGREYQRTRINPIEKDRQDMGVHLDTEVHET